MEPATDGKSLEKHLKVSALAWACILEPPTGYQPPDPPPLDDELKIRKWHEEKRGEVVAT